MADGLGAAPIALPSGCSFDLTRDASGSQLLGEAPISDEKENPYGIARFAVASINGTRSRSPSSPTPTPLPASSGAPLDIEVDVLGKYVECQ
jgi:hypothetical protein